MATPATYTPTPFAPGQTPPNMDKFKPFADAAYQQATSRLDPQFQQGRETFEQSMVNRGIMPGNEGYGRASESFERTRNDAYAGARNDALAQALAAQGQSYGQDANTYGINQGERQFGAQFGFGQERADMSDLMNLLGYGNATTAQNNATLTSDQQRSMGLLGLIPGMSPQGIDSSGAANSWMNQYNTQSKQDQDAKNAQNQAWLQLASAFVS